MADHQYPGESPGADLELLFAALANQDRLALMGVLLRGVKAGDGRGVSISALASEAEISRFSASRHLSILRSAGLVEVNYAGRRALHHLNVVRLEAVEDWLYPFILEGPHEHQDCDDYVP